jgi:hypothetical protein
MGPVEALPIVVTDGADYEHPDPGPRRIVLARGTSVSFALGTNTASGNVYALSDLHFTLPGSPSRVLTLPINALASAFVGQRIHIIVTAFVKGSAGPPTG